MNHRILGLLVLGLFLFMSISAPVQSQSSSDTSPAEGKLRQTIEDLRLQLAEREERIAELEQEKGLGRPVHPTVERLRETVSELKKTIRRQEERIGEYESLTERQEDQLRQARRERQQQMKELQEKLSNVKEAEAERQGQEMTITLDNAILFPLGRAQLKDSAKATLDEITGALSEYENYRILVEGHTDNVPVSSDRFSSNWTLSAQRAVNVTEYLDQNTSIGGERLVAAGLGKYQPVVPNTSPENRAKNRRVEIKLVPIESLQAEEKLNSASDTEDTG
jgi:chemotaxis protein MotB